MEEIRTLKVARPVPKMAELMRRAESISNSLDSLALAIRANQLYEKGRIGKKKLEAAFLEKAEREARQHISEARFIVHDKIPEWHLERFAVSADYVDKNGDLISTTIYRKGGSHRPEGGASEIAWIKGFDIVAEISTEHPFCHEAYVTSGGITMRRLGAMWAAYSPNGERIVNKCHKMVWDGKTITTTIGARTEQVIEYSKKPAIEQ